MTKGLMGPCKLSVGKGPGSLPASLTIEKISTEGNREAASAMNQFYIDKVDKLRANIPPVSAPPSSWPRSTSPFSFSFASAGKSPK
ncbi:Hypothetical protein FKW44_007808 [Caligus rogercresseyi]|uniref:Uncharacterized protein n=1 Tax=Caligus rogercresseyi TaxID=217165 RepID=A0A7T8KF79_CALRO|nr:Hypothetical protein FKW44_007808 [Caligus rogercresseyi]